MKKISLVLTLTSALLIGAQLGGIYDIKSGKVDYKISGSGNMMGMGELKVVGKKRIIFDDYGNKQLEELSQVQKQIVMGKAHIQKEHKLSYKDKAVVYSVDFKNKQIMRISSPLMAIANPKSSKPLYKQIEENLKKLGAKKVGKDKVLGFNCDVWELMGVKQCLYKGVPLKIESNIMGIKQTEIATKAKFDISLSKDAFKLPNYPVVGGSMESLMEGVAPKKLDKNALEQLDKRANSNAMQDSTAAVNFANKLNEAMKQSGVNINKSSSNQEEAMANALIAAMGGEEGMLKQMKAQMLRGANIDALNKLKSCYKDAKSLKEANSCKERFRISLGQEMSYFNSWSEAKKKESIKEIDNYIKAIPCIKGAKSMNKLQGCMAR